MFNSGRQFANSRVVNASCFFIFAIFWGITFSETYVEISEWRKDALALIKRCDSVISLYGDNSVYEKKKQMIAEYKKCDYSDEEMRKARDAKDSFLKMYIELKVFIKSKPGPVDPPREIGDYYVDPLYACSTLERDSTLAALSCRNIVIDKYFGIADAYVTWLYTNKTAGILESTTAYLSNAKEPPSDTIYYSLRKLVHTTIDSYPNWGKSINGLNPDCIKPEFYPKYELMKFLWGIDTAAVLVPQLNALYRNGNYAKVISTLLGLDIQHYGPIIYHRAAFLFRGYSVVDSLILNKYEDELRKNAKNGQKVKVDSLLRQLENTRFLFPHKVAQRKRKHVASFASQSSFSGKMNTGNGQKSKGTAPLFRYLNSGEIFTDNDFQGVTVKKWYCLAPKIENTTLECVFDGELTPAGFKIKPMVNTNGMHVCKSESVIKNAYFEAPCLFFYNFEGINEGPVEKAEVYDRGDLCIVYIENDSCEFWYDSGRHPHFVNATIQDSLYFSGETDNFIAWIGDVNRNGKIEFIVEHSASQMAQPMVQFVEKSNKNGKIIFETKAAYERNLPEPDIEW